MKLGSLFDGSGGFPLAGSLCGIEPVWASEVEPYPIAVTKSRFPNMKHLGSVTDVHGGDIEPVDIITFGSPCQDLSVAGKRAGLKHEANGDDETTRSGLFMEAVRIIKEMREATNGECPTFAVWENVPGAFSSNKGEDFRTVLEELIKIVEPTAVMPAVPKNGWPYSDSYCGDGWSLAYRVFDAQYWGVPQRRRRIYLVLDLRGQRAGKVSFEREGVRGNFATFKTAGQGTAGDAADRTGADDCERECVAYSFDSLASNSMKSKNPHSGCRRVEIAKTLDTTDPNPSKNQGGIAIVEPVPYTLKICDENILDDQGGQQITVRTDGKAPTLRAETHGNLPAVMEPVTIEPGIAAREGGHIYEGVCGTLRANAGDNQMAVAYAAGFNYLQGSKARTIGFEMEKAGTLRAGQFGDAVLVKMEVEGFDMYNQQSTGDKSRTLKTPIGGDDLPVVCYSVENHPADSRVNIDDSGKVQTLAAEAGGNSVPSVCIKECLPFDTTQVTSPQNGCNPKWGDPCHPLAAQAHPPTVICKCYDARGNGDGQTVNTLTGDHENRITDYTSVVCMAHGQANAEILEDKSPCLNCNHEQPIVAKCSGIRYIVRRLTPTECARLQGFPDAWGHPDHKDDFTDEEYRFWLDVRNTHAAINGKPQKDYTKAQMLTWYNKLHTDSSEYKMWGNGISLPTALYVMQGIAEALKGGEG